MKTCRKQENKMQRHWRDQGAEIKFRVHRSWATFTPDMLMEYKSMVITHKGRSREAHSSEEGKPVSWRDKKPLADCGQECV